MHEHHRVLLSGILAKGLFRLWFHIGPQRYWNEVTSKPSGTVAAGLCLSALWPGLRLKSASLQLRWQFCRLLLAAVACMENLCLLLGGHAVERTGVGRLYAGVLFHENLGHAACFLPPLPWCRFAT